MVEIDAKITITAIIALTVIYIVLILTDHNSETLSMMIVGLFGMIVGVFVPSPFIDNKRGVLIW